MERMYTTKTLAELLRVSTRTILRERQAGALDCLKIRGQIRFTNDQVSNYLKKRHIHDKR